MEASMSDNTRDDMHMKCVKRFEEAEQSAYDAHETALRARNYYNGTQLTSDEISELAKRGQPAIVINLIRAEVNWMLGYEMQSRVDPKAYPRNPNDEAAADTATDALRFVADSVKYDKVRSKVWENLVIEGMGGAEVVHKFAPPMKEPKIVVNRYAWDRLFVDPHAMENDYSDARYKGAVIWSDMDDLAEQYPDKKDLIEASIGPHDARTDTFEDKPYYTVWSDPSRRRCRVVLIYYIEGGQWKWCKFTKGGVLEGGDVEYVDENGESVCPLIIRSMYVEHDNGFHGVVKDFLDPQDEVNKRRSKLLHQMNSRQTWGPKGAVKSVAAMKRELAKPDGHVEIEDEFVMNTRETGVSPFNIINNADHAAGQFNLYAESKANIDRMGANSALQGTTGSTSGRAKMVDQQGGLMEIAPVYERLREFDDEIYRHLWMRVRQLWTQEKWVRVTDKEGAARFVGLNQPVTLMDALSQMPQEQVVAYARQYQLQPNDPRLQQVVGVQNSVAEMDVDIIIEDAPDTVTLEGETFEQIVQISTAQPGSVPPDVLIEAAPNLDRETKDKLLERMEQQAQQQAQASQAQQQSAAQKTSAEAQRDQAAAAKDMATAQKTMVEAQAASFMG